MATFMGGTRVVPVVTTHYINNQSKSGITPSTSSQIIRPDEDYTGLSQVTVNAIPASYIIPSGTYTVTNSGTYNISTYESVSTPAMANPTWTASLDNVNAKLTYSVNIKNGFNSVVQSFSSSYTLPTIAGTTITPSDTSQVAIESYKWTIGSIIVNSIPSIITIYKKIYDKTINDNEINAYLSTQTSISSFMFMNCNNLSSSIYGNNITFIGNSGFFQCLNLKNVSFPSLSSIGSSVFQNCNKLISANFNQATRIYNQAFSDCTSLTTINAPNVSIVYSGAFCYCYSLTNVNLPNLTSIIGGPFSYCSSLPFISFSLLSIISGGYAFLFCTNASYISLPVLEKISGSGVFANCSKIQSVTLPICSIISAITFRSCLSLRMASFPKLTSFTSTSNFMGCVNLISLYLMNSIVTTLSNSNAFSSTPIGGYSTSAGIFGSIYVPSSLLTQYQTATNWSYFSSRFVGI